MKVLDFDGFCCTLSKGPESLQLRISAGRRSPAQRGLHVDMSLYCITASQNKGSCSSWCQRHKSIERAFALTRLNFDSLKGSCHDKSRRAQLWNSRCLFDWCFIASYWLDMLNCMDMGSSHAQIARIHLACCFFQANKIRYRSELQINMKGLVTGPASIVGCPPPG